LGLTGPKDKVRDHATARQPGRFGQSIRQSLERRPDRLEHDEHAGCSDVAVDPGQVSTLYEKPMMSLVTICRFLEEWPSDLPKVDQTEDETGDDGKVGKVEAHRSTGGDGEGDVMTGSDGSVGGDGSGDDDVADSTGRSVSCVEGPVWGCDDCHNLRRHNSVLFDRSSR
jgi:hypothetical protein